MNTVYRRDLLNVLLLIVGTIILCGVAFGQTSTDQKYLFCFTQKGCSQCATIKPTWEKLRKSYKVIVIDLDKDSLNMFKTFKVEQTPLTVFVISKPTSSKEQWRFVGVKTEKEIEKMVVDKVAEAK